MSIDADHGPLTTDSLCRVLKPRPRSAPEVEHRVALADQVVFLVDLFELEDGSGWVALLFGPPGEMV